MGGSGPASGHLLGTVSGVVTQSVREEPEVLVAEGDMEERDVTELFGVVTTIADSCASGCLDDHLDMPGGEQGKSKTDVRGKRERHANSRFVGRNGCNWAVVGRILVSGVDGVCRLSSVE